MTPAERKTIRDLLAKATPVKTWRFARLDVDDYGMHVYGTCRGSAAEIIEEFRVADVRGWGHLQYRKDGVSMQDANGQVLATAPALLERALDSLDRDDELLRSALDLLNPDGGDRETALWQVIAKRLGAAP